MPYLQCQPLHLRPDEDHLKVVTLSDELHSYAKAQVCSVHRGGVLRGPKGHAACMLDYEPLSSRGMNVYHVARLAGLLYRDRHAQETSRAIRRRRRIPSLMRRGKISRC